MLAQCLREHCFVAELHLVRLTCVTGEERFNRKAPWLKPIWTCSPEVLTFACPLSM